MEIFLSVLAALFVIPGLFVEGFTLVNFVQFVKGKKTLLEKISERRANNKT